MTEQSQLGPSEDGSVILDIGGDVGALIIVTPDTLAGSEIEVSPLDGDGHRTHVAVRERRGSAGTRYAAIYPGLHAGDYTIWDLQGQAVGPVRIIGGEVTQIDWR